MNPNVFTKIPNQVFSFLSIFLLLLNSCSTEVDQFITEQDERNIANENFISESHPTDSENEIIDAVIDCNTVDFSFTPSVSTNEPYNRFSRINLTLNQPNVTGGFLVRLNKYDSFTTGNMGELILHDGQPAIRFSFAHPNDADSYIGRSTITMPDLTFSSFPGVQSNNFILPSGTYQIVKEVRRGKEVILVIDATNFTPGVFHSQSYWVMMLITKDAYQTNLYSGGVYDQNGFPPSLSISVDQQTFNAEVFNLQIEFMANCGQTIIKKYDNQFRLM
jgi:hypothetical protein